uniref:Uncharacterized protein n=1 Tax=Globisporangium ultimum (strain ATCC 200006 / CBS 805.95 / DAOM BR144) TaxID=431595 RepID=K3X9Q6_GLOUD
WVRNAFQFLLLGLELFLLRRLVRVQPVDGLGDLVVDGAAVLFRDLALQLLVVQRVAQVVRVVLEAVLGFNANLVRLVFSLVLLGFGNHAVDIGLRQTTLVVRDRDLVLLARRLLDGRHVQDTIRVNVEGHINLWHTTWHWRNAVQVELAEQVVVTGHRTLTFEHLDQHTWLVVGVGRERLRLLRWHRRVTRDQRRHHTTGGFQTERKWGHIEEQQVLELLRLVVTRQDSGLHGGTERNSLIRVDRLAWLLAVEKVRQQLLHLRDTGRTTDKHNFVHLALRELRVTEHLLNWVHGLAEVVTAHVLETGTGNGRVEVNTIEQRVNFNVRLGRRRQRTLSTFTRGTETTQRTLVRRNVLAVLALELLHEVVHETVVEIFTTQVSVTSGSLDFEDTFLNAQQRHIEGTTTKIEDEHVALTALLVQTVRNSGGRRLVNDTEHVQTGNGTGILRSLTLRVVEVSWHGNDSVAHFLADEGLRHFTHLDKHHRRNFFWLERLRFTLELHGDLWLVAWASRHSERPVLAVGLHDWVRELATDQTLSVEHRVVRVHRDLVLRGITDQTLSVRERHVRWGRTVTLVVRDDFDTVVLPHADARVRRTEIDTDGLSSNSLSHLEIFLGGGGAGWFFVHSFEEYSEMSVGNQCGIAPHVAPCGPMWRKISRREG